MGRVVFDESAEPGKWFRLDSLLKDFAADQPSDPSIGPTGAAIDLQESVSDRSSVVALSLQPNILKFATGALASPQASCMAPRREVALINPSISDTGVSGRAEQCAEIPTMLAR